MARFKLQEITGVIPALLTPFDEDERFDEKRMRRLVGHLISRGVDALYITGGTGECHLMTPDERKEVVEVVVAEVAGRIPLIAHVGSVNTRVSVDLALHAETIGIDAVASLPPSYGAAGNRAVFDYFHDLATSTDIPLIIYNIPGAGLLSFDQIREIAALDGVGGIKYTDTAHFQIMRMKQEIGGDFLVYSGCDEMALSGLAFGADGIIGSYYNLMPEVFGALYRALLSGEWETALEKQRTANAVIAYASNMQYVAFIKRALAWMGVDCGYCRRPLSNLDLTSEERLKGELRELKESRRISGVEFLDAI